MSMLKRANTLQASSKEIIVFLLLSTETKSFSFEVGQQKESSIINISLLKLLFLSYLVSRDGRKQRATRAAQVCWEMYKKEGEAKETLYTFQHPHISLMRLKRSKHSLTAGLLCLFCTALEQQKTDNSVNFRQICSTCRLLDTLHVSIFLILHWLV